ncbi:DUF5673 domain-containing protein [Helcococcus kunzii]|uniref:DUF5673 domain-containing protein n=1 Tax=Helcococcus kunzii TaxID=40091 RepID=UPI0024AE59E2|nr:DUF5673 domain-containing protein [Helcococcus kunzii]
MLAANQANRPNTGMNTMIYFLYGGLIVYFIYKLYKTHMAKKELKGKIFEFKRAVPKILWILGGLVLAFGIYNVIYGDIASGALMIALIVFLLLEYTVKNSFAENGLIIDSKFVSWKELQKWAFDAEKGELVTIYKKGFDERQSYMKVEKKDIPAIDEIIRKYKLKK